MIINYISWFCFSRVEKKNIKCRRTDRKRKKKRLDLCKILKSSLNVHDCAIEQAYPNLGMRQLTFFLSHLLTLIMSHVSYNKYYEYRWKIYFKHIWNVMIHKKNEMKHKLTVRAGKNVSHHTVMIQLLILSHGESFEINFFLPDWNMEFGNNLFEK